VEEPLSVRRGSETVGVMTESRQTLKQKYISPSQGPDCIAIYKAEGTAKNLTDEEILLLVREKHIPSHQLEKICEDYERGVSLR
jgi:hypothetical protein